MFKLLDHNQGKSNHKIIELQNKNLSSQQFIYCVKNYEYNLKKKPRN